MYLFCFVKRPICQTPTKMSPADAEDTLINNLFSSYLISGSPYHLQVSGLLGIALDLLTDVADMHRNSIIRSDSLHMPDRFIDLADGQYLAALLH